MQRNVVASRQHGRSPVLALFSEADDVKAAIQAVNVRIVDARRRWARSKSASDAAALEEVENEGQRLGQQFDALIRAMERASGLTPEQLDELDAAGRGERAVVIDRADLVAERVAPSLYVEDHLPAALERIRRALPQGWLERESRQLARLSDLAEPDAFVSLTKNLRRASEAPSIHRFRQALYVADDLLQGNVGYDHFAGASLVPTIVQFGRKLDIIDQLRGKQTDRVRRLWSGPSTEVDSTMFELLVAAGCVEHGRSVEFIPEGAEKTADIRVHDPFPLLLECKRQSAVTDYEVAEEDAVRSIFIELRDACRRRGIIGTFAMSFTEECVDLDRHDVVDSALRSSKNRVSAFPWGTVSFRELRQTIRLSAPTPIFSPRMLQEVFGWNSDLPEFDGICAGFENLAGLVVDEVRGATGLTWVNTSEQAIRKRTWAPVSLLNQAVEQITPGEWGLIYIAYQEGARSAVADARLAAFRERLNDWSHRGDIRVPIIFLNRLYPRALFDGQPDLIENTVQLLSELYGSPELVDNFPSAVFT